ncbi:hypothetical protein MHBO_003892 [Bonamia ostreae]|uniref:mitogen-activated protein kinase kinase n=1 Tax=Bonamia ostreae TaxID=126728 RepID=A0ABV2ARU0_9EUKA
MHHVFVLDKFILIAMERCELDLYYLKMNFDLTEEVIEVIIGVISLALNYLHYKLEVVHYDLKIENVLLTKNGIIKICDFGMSRRPGINDENITTSFFSKPPELTYYNTAIDYSFDSWGLGMIIFFICCDFTPEYKIDYNNFIEIPSSCFIQLFRNNTKYPNLTCDIEYLLGRLLITEKRLESEDSTDLLGVYVIQKCVQKIGAYENKNLTIEERFSKKMYLLLY